MLAGGLALGVALRIETGKGVDIGNRIQIRVRVAHDRASRIESCDARLVEI